MSKVSQPKKTGSTTSTKKAPSKGEDLAVTMTIVEPEEKASVTKKAVSGETASTEAKVSKVEQATELSFEVIQEQAYFLWEKDGYQHGLDEVHWLQAETLLKQQVQEEPKAAAKK